MQCAFYYHHQTSLGQLFGDINLLTMHYNPDIHHRRSIRLKRYDYSLAGLYFVTICVQNRPCLFGKITDNEMILNEYGRIAYNEWFKTPNIRSNIQLDVFIVMSCSCDSKKRGLQILYIIYLLFNSTIKLLAGFP
jgi:hypothetical protein